MRQRQVAWAFLALGLTGWLFASCGSDSSSNGVNAGLGVACASDKDCTPYALLCDKILNACTECSMASDCAAGQTCAGSRCRAIVACSNSLACPGQVCDQALNPPQCVGCTSDNDCSRTTHCFRTECVPSATTVGAGGGSGAGGSVANSGAGGSDQTGGGAGVGQGGASGVGGNVSMGGAAGTGGLGGTGGNGGGTGGNGGNGGNGGSIVNPGCMCSGGQVCTLDSKCVFAHDIHTSLTCDGSIAQISGRSGKWYGFASAGNGYQLLFGDPGPTWSKHSCAVVFVGGPNGTLGATNSAGIGVLIADGAVYSLAAETGIQMTMEGGQRTLVIVKTKGGGYFGAYVAATGNAAADRTALFSQMFPLANSLEANLNLATATDIQFSPEFPSMAWGFALYAVSFTP